MLVIACIRIKFQLLFDKVKFSFWIESAAIRNLLRSSATFPLGSYLAVELSEIFKYTQRSLIKDPQKTEALSTNRNSGKLK